MTPTRGPPHRELNGTTDSLTDRQTGRQTYFIKHDIDVSK